MALSTLIPATAPANLQAYYQCNESSGNLVDSSGSGLTLTVNGSPTYGVSGPDGDAITFDITAVTPQFATGSAPWTTMPSAWSVFWINRRQQDLVATSYYWSFDDTVEAAAAVTAFNGTAGQLDNVRWLVRNNAGSDVYHETCPVDRFDPNDWQCCMMTYDGTTFRFYQDGQLSLANNITDTQGALDVDTFSINRLANNMAPGGTIQTIQHVAVWDTALTWRQYRDLYFDVAAVGGDLPWFDVGATGEDTPGGVAGAYKNAVIADGGTLYRMGDEDQTQWVMAADDDLDKAANFESDSVATNTTFRKVGPAFEGNAIGLSTSGVAIEIPDPTNGGVLPFSVEIWVKGTHASNDYFFTHRDGGASPEPFVSLLWETVGTDMVTLTVRDNTGNTLVVRGDWPDDVNWHHVVAVIESTGITLYVDNVATSAADTFTGAFDASVTAVNGITSNGGASYTNKITADVSELAVYPGVALSSTQVDNHYSIIADGGGGGGGVGLLSGIIGSGVF